MRMAAHGRRGVALWPVAAWLLVVAAVVGPLAATTGHNGLIVGAADSPPAPSLVAVDTEPASDSGPQTADGDPQPEPKPKPEVPKPTKATTLTANGDPKPPTKTPPSTSEELPEPKPPKEKEPTEPASEEPTTSPLKETPPPPGEPKPTKVAPKDPVGDQQPTEETPSDPPSEPKPTKRLSPTDPTDQGDVKPVKPPKVTPVDPVSDPPSELEPEPKPKPTVRVPPKPTKATPPDADVAPLDPEHVVMTVVPSEDADVGTSSPPEPAASPSLRTGRSQVKAPSAATTKASTVTTATAASSSSSRRSDANGGATSPDDTTTSGGPRTKSKVAKPGPVGSSASGSTGVQEPQRPTAVDKSTSASSSSSASGADGAKAPGGTKKGPSCGVDASQPVKCFLTDKAADSEMYVKAQAVARVLVGDTTPCNGVLLSKAGYFLTSSQCIRTAAQARSARIEFGAESDECQNQCAVAMGCEGADVLSGGELVVVNPQLGYAVIRIDAKSHNLVAKYGTLSLRNVPLAEEEQVFLAYHPGSFAKRIAAMANDKPLTAAPVDGEQSTGTCGPPADLQVSYSVGTDASAVGAPIIARSDSKIVALHLCSECQTGGSSRGVSGAAIWKDIKGRAKTKVVA